MHNFENDAQAKNWLTFHLLGFRFRDQKIQELNYV